jgi:4-amino-4-deoxy-L-arabinose transferase-like glycosyltransferase
MNDIKDMALALSIVMGLIIVFLVISALAAVIVPLSVIAGLTFIVYVIIQDSEDRR